MNKLFIENTDNAIRIAQKDSYELAAKIQELIEVDDPDEALEASHRLVSLLAGQIAIEEFQNAYTASDEELWSNIFRQEQLLND